MMNFRFEPRPDHLFVEAVGTFDPPSARSAVERMVTICRELSLLNVFVDARGMREVLSIADRFDLVTYLTEQRAPIRVAVLVTQTQADINLAQRKAPVVDRRSSLHTTASLEEVFGFLGIQK